MEVVLSKDAQKHYKHLSNSEQKKIKKKLLLLKEDPWNGKKLTGEFQEKYSLKAWPYRIIYKINKQEKRVEVSTILHRQGAYK